MATEVFVPKMTDFMEEAVIVAWLVNEGDAVTEGQPILEMETDKAIAELEAPAIGLPQGDPPWCRARRDDPCRGDHRLRRRGPRTSRFLSSLRSDIIAVALAAGPRRRARKERHEPRRPSCCRHRCVSRYRVWNRGASGRDSGCRSRSMT